MKIVFEPINLPDDADALTIQDAVLHVNYRVIRNRNSDTDLENKCGSCSKFCILNPDKSIATGYCKRKSVLDVRQRSTPKCKHYVRRDQ